MADQQQDTAQKTGDAPAAIGGDSGATQQAVDTPTATNGGDDVQARIDRAAAAARKEERERIQRDADTKARKAAEDALKEQGKWQDLANERQQEIDRLSAVQANHEALTAAVQEIIEDGLKDLPAELRAALDTEQPMHKQLKQLRVLAKAAAKLNAQPTPQGNGASPRVVGAVDNDKAAQASQAVLYRN